MQGNRQEGRNQPVDRGWESMRRILDREMPHRERRRALAWWPIGSAVIVLIASLWFGNEILTDRDASIPSFEPKTIDVPINDPGSPKADDQLKPATQQSGQEQVISSAQDVIKPDAGNRTISEGFEPASATQIIAQEAIQEDAKSAPMANNQNPSVKNAEQLASSPTRVVALAGSGAQIERSEEVSSLESRKHEDVTLLTSPGIQWAPDQAVVKFDNRGSVNGALALTAPVTSNISPWSLRVYGDAHLVAPVAFRGIEGGVAVGYDITPRWAVSAGVGYGHYDNSGIVNFSKTSDQFSQTSYDLDVPQELLDTTSFLGTADQQNVIISTISYDTAQLLTNRLNYIHVPMSVSYRATRRLAIDAGVKLAFLVSAPANAGLEAPGFTNTGSAGQPSLKLDRDTDYLRDEGLLRTFDVAPTIGLRWSATRRLDLGVHLVYGLIPYIDRTYEGDRDDYNRSLALGLSYRIF